MSPEDGSFERGLLDAAETGSEKRVQRYLGYDLQVNFADSQGRTALHLAAKNGYDTIVKSLVAAHCNVDAFSEVYGTALCEAASANRPSIVQLLLEAGADVNAPGGSLHGSAVHAACASGKLPILLLLLDAGASVSATPTIVPKENHNADGSHSPGAIRQYSCTPLYSAIDTGHCHLVPALISAGADVNTTCKKWFESLATNKETTQTTCLEEAPLHCAAANGFGAIVELLLDQGVSIDIKTSDGLTPVMITTIYNRPRCLRMLLDRGAGLDDRDTEEGRGMSALDYAASGGNRECLMTLVNFGAPMDGQDSKGNNALHHACVNGHAACLEALITAGVAVNGSDKKGQRALGPLACAVGAGHVECAEVLIKRGADTHWTDVSKQTALFHASTWACVELLARQEATPDKQQEPNAATRSSWKEKTTRLLVSNNRLNKLANKKLNMNHRDARTGPSASRARSASR
ncbi:Ankyrin-1 [Pseudocercospora fuligena]|uniref:Ankyrin-1 n=1 Tax=Pseudocercospora fuligena TaxID=685502 RepID=A0A8H6VKS9_9PEZI|nr:Ankyrin-1 [Pseudocercospora fuligena]